MRNLITNVLFVGSIRALGIGIESDCLPSNVSFPPGVMDAVSQLSAFRPAIVLKLALSDDLHCFFFGDVVSP